MSAKRMHCGEELSRDLNYPQILPDETLFRWFNDRYSTSKHLLTLYSAARALRARRIVEVGFGRSSFVLARAAYENRGFFQTCDRTDFSELFTAQERHVAQQFVGSSQEFWPSIRHGIDLAFLDYFSDPKLDESFVESEIKECFSKLKKNGLLFIHDTNDSRFTISTLIEKLADRLGAEHVVLPYNYGLSILRRTASSPFGTLYDSTWKKADPCMKESRPTIFIPQGLENTLTGGPRSFMQNILHGLDDDSYPIVRDEGDVERAQAIFFPIKYDVKRLEEWKGQGKKIVQRLDGVYYPSQHGEEYKERNSDIEYIYKELVDVVIFQSGYSRDQCFEVMGEHSGATECIIYNGAVPNPLPNGIPTRKLARKQGGVHKALMLGHIRHPVMIEPLVDVCRKLDGAVELTVAGKIDDNLQHFFDSKYVSSAGQLDREDVQRLMHQSDFLLYSVLNPNCPNAVVEAHVCGLPVVGFNTGSMRELCLHNKELLAPVSDEIIQEAKDFQSEELLNCVKIYLANEDTFRERTSGASSYFLLERMAKEYIEVFSSIEKISEQASSF